MRAGRFDATFFVDLPTHSERLEIVKIMNRKWKADIPLEFADRLSGYTGAEIEQLVKFNLGENFCAIDQPACLADIFQITVTPKINGPTVGNGRGRNQFFARLSQGRFQAGLPSA